jgi:hypothetical protein
MLTSLVLPSPSTHAACAADPNALSFRQMIVKQTTGNRTFPLMFLGTVRRISDVGGQPGGDTIARIDVAQHPVGFAPAVARVHFWTPPPMTGAGTGAEDNFLFKRHRRYVVVADRTAHGSFIFDGGCGQTRWVRSDDRFHRLVRLARST